jgi:hypothetical protein
MNYEDPRPDMPGIPPIPPMPGIPIPPMPGIPIPPMPGGNMPGPMPILVLKLSVELEVFVLEAGVAALIVVLELVEVLDGEDVE